MMGIESKKLTVDTRLSMNEFDSYNCRKNTLMNELWITMLLVRNTDGFQVHDVKYYAHRNKITIIIIDCAFDCAMKILLFIRQSLC